MRFMQPLQKGYEMTAAMEDEMKGVCGCSIGPPPGGICNACGTVGPPLPHDYGRYQFTPNQLTEADIRRIVREELERALREKP